MKATLISGVAFFLRNTISFVGENEMVRSMLVIIIIMMSLRQDAGAQAPPSQAPPNGQSAVAPLANASADPSSGPSSKVQYPLDAFTDFSAVMIGNRMEPGEGSDEAHIYRSGKLMRMEGPKGHGYFITDLITGETYGISAASCTYDAHPYVRASPFPAAAKPGATVTRNAAGKETVDGHSCQIENVTVASPKFANPLAMRFWEADDLQGFPIKIEFLVAGGRDPIIRYKNVVLGPQDPTLFIHPNSCQSLPGTEMTPAEK